MRLIVTLGLPAAGKSTYAARFRSRGYEVCTADSIRDGARAFHAFNAMCEATRVSLLQGRNTIVDACSLIPANRTRMLHLGRASLATCELHILATPLSTCIRREVARGGPVRDWDVLEALFQKARALAAREGWDAMYMVPR